MKYQKGGWIRMLTDYYEAKKGDILQIDDVISPEHVEIIKNGKRVGSGVWTEEAEHRISECEWIGMEKPQENGVILKTEKWVPKAGEYAVMTEKYGGAKVGEVVKILERQTDLECHYVENLNGEGCGAPFWACMRPATPEEIPYTQSEKSFLVEVLKRYPKGTKYKGLRDENVQISQGIITLLTDEKAAVGFDYVYKDGRWADVIEEKQEDLLEEAKRRFPVGTRYYNGYDGVAVVEEQSFRMHGDCVAAEVGKGFLYRPQLGWAEKITSTYIPQEVMEKCCDRELVEEIRSYGKIESLPSEIIVKKEKKKRKVMLFS